ncbi:hypothetical protein [Spirochaeta isovalerica]|uniref:Uncharacterized protein n=1 Tax=Spirochaeta isovalerica TaxID=150 RepID=A0A841RGL9_9SPIO|nr:hypothetical protein [Spirochaeta isovalerica]MBB6482357.1 hypothetical protein [Spirochaeta isovalerica]
MTLSLRNRLIRLTILFCFVLSAFFLITFFYLNKDDYFSLSSLVNSLNKLDRFTSDSAYNSLYWAIITASVLYVFSIITSLVLFHYFKKKVSPEIFFFILFILSLSLQSIRLFELQLIMIQVSPFYGVLITRAYYFFRLFGVFCFFASSLFPIGVQFQKLGTILISILLLSFTISALMPIDPTRMNGFFLYNISDSLSLLVMTLSIRVLTVINFIRVSLTTRSRNYLAVLIAAVLIIAGDELLLLLPVPLISITLLFTGAIIYSRSLYTYYLWI